MKKQTTQTDVWNDDVSTTTPEFLEQDTTEAFVKPVVSKPTSKSNTFDLEGLMTDFPTATELERFVYEQTGIALALKGRNNKLKYQIALDTLNGAQPDSEFITNENPYLERNELIPVDPIKPIPQRDPRLPSQDELQHQFHHFNIPHPEQGMRALDAKVIVCFKKYIDGSISYEIVGPLEQHSIGEKLDKYGRSRPEKLTWVDPRTGEQAVRYNDGTYTRMGQRLVTYCKSNTVNKNSSIWDTWIDRDFTSFTQDALDNPWN